ncbi:hypothetical protein [Spirilliplanes yamanashiensis]|uniref:Uncharacterized protein n=1 Tax=Spirilliplanes yamanashiensis TaxID=42233 RepID=A0A8J4DHL6_9ACTN|nr:hypothetical protein [Spirilliplanes yamanashiensis]MDP9819231.1 hypothetical protein [Spirilliplanes yamanashiensis]GIJ01946.1 hypothetical protein Sya03_12980 [Spirilliplanes yamanashiensis]
MQERDTDVFEPASGLGFRPATGGGYRADALPSGFAEPEPARAGHRTSRAGRIFAAAAFGAVLLSAGTGYALGRSAPAGAADPEPAPSASAPSASRNAPAVSGLGVRGGARP